MLVSSHMSGSRLDISEFDEFLCQTCRCVFCDFDEFCEL